MQSINKETVQHLAALARIAVSEAEMETLTKNLATILDYVDALKAVNTDGLPEVSQITGLKNILREDLPSEASAKEGEAEIHKRLIDAFPEKEGDYLKVKAVFEETVDD